MADLDPDLESQARVTPLTQPRTFLPDPGTLWVILRRRIWIFLAAMSTILALAAAYTLSRPALYGATATVLIQPKKNQVIKGEPLSPDMSGETNVIDTEVQILSSRRLAGRVAEALNLEQHPEYGSGARTSQAKAEPGTHPLAAALLSRVVIRRVGLTYLININGISTDRQLAASIANEFARQYVAQQAETKNMSAEEARRFLGSRIDELRAEAVAADAALQRYKVANGLMSAEGATMAEQEVSTLNQEIAKARAEVAEKTGELSAAQSQVGRGGGGANVAAALQSGTVGELRRKEAQASGKLAELSARYGEQHPEVRKTREELADTREQLQREIDRILSSLQSDVQAARSRLASLESSLARARGTLAGNSSAQPGYLELERKAEAARSIYTAFLNRSQELVSQEGLLRADARVEALARAPSFPFSPNYFLAALFGAIGAVLAGLGAVAVAEYLDRRVRTRNDIESRLRVRYAGAIPDLRSTLGGARVNEAPHDYLINHSLSSFAEAFRSLRTVAFSGGGNEPPRVLAITSALPREGKSTTAICLARAIALSGTKAVLLDCDARRRSASEALLPLEWNGLGDLLRGECSLEDALYKDASTELCILGSTVPPSHGDDIFAGGQLQSLLTDLRDRFDVIIIDTAPVLGIAETRIIAAAADRVLLLARWKSTSLKAADTAVDLLLNTGAKLRGVALTLVDVRKYASTGQEDVYSYHSKFQGYYSE